MVNARTPNREGHLSVFLVAGEASGDAYGAQLIRELKRECTLRGITLHTVGWGGDAMAGEGMRLLTHIRDVSFMGFWEVAKRLPTILGNLRRAKNDVIRENPDMVITIDFPGFNMRLAKALRNEGHPALRVQWVAPQVWAWKAGRVKQLARDFDAVCPILPFEQETLTRAGVHVWNEGHPLLDLLPAEGETKRDLALALLPGSRTQELQHHLPVMIQSAQEGAKKGLWTLNEVVIAGAPGRTKEDYALGHEAGIDVRFGQTHDLLSRAQFAWVASGTATLEAALLGTPHALVYRTSALTYFLAKQFVKVKFIGLPNLLLGREVVPELIQDALKPSSLLELSNLDRATQQRAFEELRSVLGGPGASARVAKQVLLCFEPQP